MAVSHSAYLRALLAFYLGTPYDKARALAQENCCINLLEFETDEKGVGREGTNDGGKAKAKALAINEARHLDLAKRREEGR